MILSIDVGGTKTLLALFDGSKIVKTQKFETPIMYPDFVRELKQAIHDVVGDTTLSTCSIALPGVIDRDNGIALSFGNLPWEHVQIRGDLADVLDCPIYLENDAKLAGLSEAHEVQDLYKRVLYVTISTGIGLGLTVDGKIDHSVHDAGGKAIMLEHQGKIMAWEEFASGKAITAKFGKRASDITDSQDWYVIARNIAIGLVDLVTLLSPDCIVIGGGVGTHLDKFQEKLFEELEIYHSKMITIPPIIKAKHPEEAVVYGGYLLAKYHESQRT
jgi:glucokinase